MYYSDCFKVVLPDGHRFPMHKYRDTRLAVQEWHTKRLAAASAGCSSSGTTGRLSAVRFQEAPFPTLNDITGSHCPDYWGRFSTGSLQVPN
jgi:hypothetical protein